MSDDDIRILVKEWLQSQNRKSYQLAEEIGIRPQTFYAQMSVRKISANTKKRFPASFQAWFPIQLWTHLPIRKNVTRKNSESRNGSGLTAKHADGLRNNAAFPSAPYIPGLLHAVTFPSPNISLSISWWMKASRGKFSFPIPFPWIFRKRKWKLFISSKNYIRT